MSLLRLLSTALCLGVITAAPIESTRRRTQAQCFSQFSSILMGSGADGCPSIMSWGMESAGSALPSCPFSCAKVYKPFWALCGTALKSLPYAPRMQAFDTACGSVTASSPTAQPTVLTTSAPTFDCSPNLVFASGICPIASRSAALVDSLTCSTVCAPVFRTWWSHCSSLFKNDQSLLGPLTKYNEKCLHPVAPTAAPTPAPTAVPTTKATDGGFCPDKDVTGLGCDLLIKTLAGMTGQPASQVVCLRKGFDLHTLLSPIPKGQSYAAETCPTTCKLDMRDKCGVCGGNGTSCKDICPDQDPTGMGCKAIVSSMRSNGHAGVCTGKGVDLHDMMSIYPKGKYSSTQICPFTCRVHTKDVCGVCGGDNHTCPEGRKHMLPCPDNDQTGMGCPAIMSMMKNMGKGADACSGPKGVDVHSVMQLYPKGKYYTGTMCPTTCGLNVRDSCGVCHGNTTCAPTCQDKSPFQMPCPQLMSALTSTGHTNICQSPGIDLNKVFSFLQKGKYFSHTVCCKTCQNIAASGAPTATSENGAPTGHR